MRRRRRDADDGTVTLSAATVTALRELLAAGDDEAAVAGLREELEMPPADEGRCIAKPVEYAWTRCLCRSCTPDGPKPHYSGTWYEHTRSYDWRPCTCPSGRSHIAEST